MGIVTGGDKYTVLTEAIAPLSVFPPKIHAVGVLVTVCIIATGGDE
jgi:hypothetical protein